MKNKASAEKKVSTPSSNEHEADSFGWLAEVRDALSPYWAARLQFQPESQGRVEVVQVPRQQVPPHSLRMVWPQE
jgi:hypothetical protein